MTNKLYSIQEAAELLGVSRSYVYLLKDMGKIKATKIGAQYVIAQEEIDRYRDKANESCSNNSQNPR